MVDLKVELWAFVTAVCLVVRRDVRWDALRAVLKVFQMAGQMAALMV